METGLQDRPTYQLVNISQKYSSNVFIEIDNRKIDYKSIMGVMSLGLAPNTTITLIVVELMKESY
ncbi:HPr family phosphocarrier protein [Anaerobacillus alkalilacustris]|uniref:HPr family phosphocarrier protein n=1 Tax=Anaerobacillus alkalilacustris TaxID=393763 RepID=UPI001470A73A